MINKKKQFQYEKIVDSDIGLSCQANQDIPQNTIVFESTGLISDKATKHSVQIDFDLHLIADNDLIYVNHSFTPNCRMVVDKTLKKIKLITIRDIKKNEDLTFNYNTTEWELSCPFQDVESQQDVLGCKFLNREEIKSLWNLFPDWIKEKLLSDIPLLINAISLEIRESTPNDLGTSI